MTGNQENLKPKTGESFVVDLDAPVLGLLGKVLIGRNRARKKNYCHEKGCRNSPLKTIHLRSPFRIIDLTFAVIYLE